MQIFQIIIIKLSKEVDQLYCFSKRDLRWIYSEIDFIRKYSGQNLCKINKQNLITKLIRLDFYALKIKKTGNLF